VAITEPPAPVEPVAMIDTGDMWPAEAFFFGDQAAHVTPSRREAAAPRRPRRRTS
jgi:hypothetical protein